MKSRSVKLSAVPPPRRGGTPLVQGPLLLKKMLSSKKKKKPGKMNSNGAIGLNGAIEISWR